MLRSRGGGDLGEVAASRFMEIEGVLMVHGAVRSVQHQRSIRTWGQQIQGLGRRVDVRLTVQLQRPRWGCTSVH